MPNSRPTKHYLPEPVADAVPRLHLLARLRPALSRKLTVVCAPAGFGKTTLVASWLQEVAADDDRGGPHTRAAWYALDPTDNDFATFVADLAAAMRRAAPEVLPDWVDLDHRPSPAAPEQVAAEWADGLSELDGQLIVALEDYHLITDPAIHRLLSQLLRQMPPSLHLIVMTRHDPPLGLARLRAEGALTELRMEDLAFSEAETEALLTGVLGEPLRIAEVETLWQQTEGWAVGVRLAAISLRSAPDRHQFIADFSRHGNRHIADYLVDEALSRQPADVQDFLLKTSILSRLSGPLAAAVVGLDRRQGQSRLADLNERGLFLTPLDGYQGWYRYHAQFQTLLHNRLTAAVSDEEVAALHGRAAEWLAEQGLIDQALPHFRAAGEAGLAACLVEQHAVRLENGEEWTRLARWLDLLPEELVDQRPGLLLARAWLLFARWTHDPIPALVEQAEAILRAEPHVYSGAMVDPLWGQCHALLTTTATPSVSIADKLVHGAEALRRLPAVYARARASTLNVYGHWLGLHGRLAEARRLNEAEMAATPPHDAAQLARLSYNLGVLSYYFGSVDDLSGMADVMMARSQAANLPTLSVWAEWGKAVAALEGNDVEAGSEGLEGVFARAEAAHTQTLLLSAYLLLPLYAARRQAEAAATILAILGERVRQQPDANSRSEFEALEAFWALLQGDHDRAARWAARADRQPATFNETRRGLILARILLALGGSENLKQAETVLLHHQAQYQGYTAVRGPLAIVIHLALVYHAQGRMNLALNALRQALDLGYPHGYRRSFIEHGAPIGELLHELSRDRAYAASAGALLGLLSLVTPPSEGWERRLRDGTTIIVEPLSDREMEILDGLGRGQTNKEIAHDLGISPLTVRNHTVNIYGKLHVESRKQAVTRARELGILRLPRL